MSAPLIRDHLSPALAMEFDAMLAQLDQLAARVEELEAGLRYITGRDVPGYEAHMRPEEVARKLLVGS